MRKYDFGFIGAGNMGTALLQAVRKADGEYKILISDADQSKAEKKAEQLGCDSANNVYIAKNAKFIYLGVKPQVLPDVLAEIAPVIKSNPRDSVLVTMAAGIKIKSIEQAMGENTPVIRIMPNTPVSVGKGMILYCTNSAVNEETETEFVNSLKFSGELDKLSEDLIDAGCSVSGCGPAFVYMFAEYLAQGGVSAGLPKDKALKYATQTIIGAGEMLKQTNIEPNDLKNAVCSPGGSTIEGVKYLEQNGFAEICINTVKKSYERTKELGK